MSPDNSAVPGADGGVPAWEQMMRAMLGDGADEAIRELQERGFDPGAMAAASGLPDDPAALQQVFAQVQAAARRVRRRPGQLADGPRPRPPAGRRRRRPVADRRPDARRCSTRSPSPSCGSTPRPTCRRRPARPRAWSRAEWVEATLPTWRTLTEPVASSLSVALVGALGGCAARRVGPEDLALPGGIEPGQLLRQLGSAVFGMQVGQAAGTLAHEVFGTTDIGLPLLDRPTPALVAANVDAFAEGLDAPAEEVRLFLALREAAATRLFTHVPWLRAHLLADRRGLRARHHHRRRPARGGRRARST